MMYQEIFPVGRTEYNRIRGPRHEPPEAPYFIRGTTPEFEFNLFDDTGELDLSALDALEVTVSQEVDGESIVVTKTASDIEIDGGTVRFQLTQEDTLKFVSGDEPFPKFAWVQVRGLNDNGSAWATLAEGPIKVYKIQREGVINAGT